VTTESLNGTSSGDATMPVQPIPAARFPVSEPNPPPPDDLGPAGSATPPAVDPSVPYRVDPAGELDLLVGRPPSHFLHVGALLLAGAADLAAFYAVIATILADYAWAVWLVVLGVTAMAVMLTHLGGAAFRDGRDGTLRDGIPIACIAWGVWLTLGLAASYVRWKSGNYAALGDSDQQAVVLPAAVMLLALYLATGAVAGVGAYLTHRPVLSALVRARWRRRRLARRHFALIESRTRATSVLEQREREHSRDTWRWKRSRDRYHALADEMRHFSSLYMAQRMQEPPATDGLTQARDRAGPDAPTMEQER
jgi:hypothetical protein